MSEQNKCEHSKYKLCFTLKQHTPIIHFQADQHGATLRASELKPKLDSFLIEKLKLTETKKIKGKEKIVPKEEYKSWFIGEGKEHLALDYKVRIEEDISIKKEIPKRNPLFFANIQPNNMQDDEYEKIKKRFKFHPNIFKVVIIVFDTNLLIVIDNYFSSFIFQTNFGTRQSKGFGSFYLDEAKDIPINQFKMYSFKSKVNEYEKDIGLFYSFLRAGINFPCGKYDNKAPCNQSNNSKKKITRFYVKAAIFSYAKYKKITWDKKVIKEKYLDNDYRYKKQKMVYVDKNNAINFHYKKERLVRDLFGLSSTQTWMSYNKMEISKEDKNRNDDKDRTPVISRFKSPITFKPIVEDNNGNMRIYFWANNSYEKILNETFIIKSNKHHNESLEITTPSKFSFDNFFEFVLKIDLEKCVSKKDYRMQKEYTILKKILKDLNGGKS